MKTCFFILSLLINGVLCAQPVLHWKFENATDYAMGSHCCFQFDVAVSSTGSGTYLNEANLFLRYNPDSFFPDYAGSGLLTVEPLNFLTQQVFGQPIYQINDATDHSVDIFSIGVLSNYPVANPMFEGLIPAYPTYISLFTIKMIYSNGVAGIEFVDSLMNGRQYYLDQTHPQPTPFGIPPLYAGIYDNTLINYQPGPHTFDLDLKVFLEGAYDETSHTMSTILSANNDIPQNHPFNPQLPYYNNNLPCWYYPEPGPTLNIPSNTVDWILLEERDADEITDVAGTVIRKRIPLLLTNEGACYAPLVPVCKNLFIVLYHRNHLPIANAAPMQPVAKNSDCWWFEYDFTTGPDKVYGGNMSMKELEPGIWGMIAGDGNADGYVNNNDKLQVWRIDQGNSGYLGGDYNLDGECNNTDRILVWSPNTGYGSQVP